MVAEAAAVRRKILSRRSRSRKKEAQKAQKKVQGSEMNWGVWPGFCASSAQVLQQNLPNWAFWPAPQGVCASPNQGWPVTCASTDQSWPGHQACASSSQEPLRPFAPRAQEPVREEESNSEEWETTPSETREQSHQETVIAPGVQMLIRLMLMLMDSEMFVIIVPLSPTVIK